MITENLKPCPFCGSSDISSMEDSSIVALGREYGRVMCTNCEATITCLDEDEKYVPIEEYLYKKIPARKGIEIAIERWNRRKGDE